MATTAEDTLNNWYTAKTVGTPTAGSGLLSAANSATGTTTPVVAPAAYKPTTLGDPTKWDVTKDQTVQGQIENVISKDNPLMQLAATRGSQQANARGMLNSSMGIGAAQDSVIAAATPIAQADADVNARAAGYNADTSNTFAKTNQAASNEAASFGAQAINRSNEFNATNQMTQQQSLFDANVKASLAQIDNEAQMDRQTQAVAGTLSDHFSSAISEINRNSNMSQASKDYSIKQLYDTYKAQLSLISAVGAIPDVSVLLNADFSGNSNVYGDAQNRKATGQSPTQNDVANGFATYSAGSLVWSI